VTNQEDENQLNWSIKPTELESLPNNENLYLVKAFEFLKHKTIQCYLIIATPERIVETAIVPTPEGNPSVKSIYEIENKIIPAIASECYGNYELYYAKENPQVGIDILKDGIGHAINKNIVAEDLGYILRDEGRVLEAIEAFKISEENEPSSEFIYLELSVLFERLGNAKEQQRYQQKFKYN